MSIETIKARAAAATPGPWGTTVVDSDGYEDIVDAEEATLFMSVTEVADARFIAHARTDVELLLDVAEAAAGAAVEKPHTGVVEHPREYVVLPRAHWQRISDALAALEAAP